MSESSLRSGAPIAVALVLVHLVVIALHDAAHGSLGVELLPWQTIYAYSLIVAAPLAAAGMLLAPSSDWRRRGAWLLAASMLASFAFGVAHHYVLVSNDHVAHLPLGRARGLFRGTAFAMAALELAAAGFAMQMLRARSSARAASEHAAAS